MMMTQRELTTYLERNLNYLTLRERNWVHDMIMADRLAEAKITVDRLVNDRKSWEETRGEAM